MKTTLALVITLLSLNSFADSLHCRGLDSRVEIHGVDLEDSLAEDEVSTVDVWSRQYEQARYSDIFSGHGARATVKQLMAKKVIKASYMNATFQLDLAKKTIVVKENGRVFKDTVTCEYRD